MDDPEDPGTFEHGPLAAETNGAEHVVCDASVGWRTPKSSPLVSAVDVGIGTSEGSATSGPSFA